MAFQAGMTAEQFWDSTVPEINARIEARHQNELNEDRRARKIAHMVWSTAVSEKDWQNEYEWWPIEGDPTPAQLERAWKKANEREIKSFQKGIDDLKKRGLIPEDYKLN